MKGLASVLGATVFVLATAAPAAADYVRLGSVDVGFRTDGDVSYSRFGGRLESLRLTASQSDIFCRSVVVRFDNGDTQNVFAGRLDERRPVDVDLRGRARRVDSIRFACRSDEFRGGRIYVDGEVGRYRDEWRRDRDWDRVWSGLFGGSGRMGGSDRGWGDRDNRGNWGDRGDRGNWGDRGNSGDRGDWAVLGQMSFEGRNDRESNFTGWNGRNVERLAFRPIDGDAQCMSIVATMGNGRKIKLADGRVWERGRVAVYDLPGDRRDVTKIYLRCRALNGWRVTIEVLGRR